MAGTSIIDVTHFLQNLMRQYILCIFFLIGGLPSLMPGPAECRAAVREIGPDKTFTSLTLAIRESGPHDTLKVFGGLYREGNILIDKPLTLLGFTHPVIDGQYKYECLTLKADSIVLRGFTVRHSGRSSLTDPGGIKVEDSRGSVIEGNILDDNFFGIYLSRSSQCRVLNNRIKAFGTDEQQIGNGIHAWKCDSLIITGNRAEGHRDGIYFEFVTGSVIWRNISTGNVRYGIHFMFSNHDAYIGNIFRHNGAGVAVMFSNHVTMMNNTFEDNWGDAAYGILLKEISDSYIAGNRFRQNTAGLYLEGASRMTVERNLFEGNGWGLRIQASCMDNAVNSNNFIRNTFDCSTNGDLVLSTFHANYWDHYEGYDLDRDGTGDVPYHPLSLFSVIVEKNPPVMLLFRSFMVTLLDRSERMLPSLTPEHFRDQAPRMKPYDL